MNERFEQHVSKIQAPETRLAVHIDSNVSLLTPTSSGSADSVLPKATVGEGSITFSATIPPNVRYGHGTQVDWVPPTGMQNIQLKPDADGRVNRIQRPPSFDTNNRAPGTPLQRPADFDKMTPGNWQKPPYDIDKKNPRYFEDPKMPAKKPIDTDKRNPRVNDFPSPNRERPRSFDTDKPANGVTLGDALDHRARMDSYDAKVGNVAQWFQGNNELIFHPGVDGKNELHKPNAFPNRDGAAPNRDKPRFDTDKPANGVTLGDALDHRARMDAYDAKVGNVAHWFQGNNELIFHPGVDGRNDLHRPNAKGYENSHRHGMPANDASNNGTMNKDTKSAYAGLLSDPGVLADYTSDRQGDQHIGNYINQDKAARQAKAVAAAARQEKITNS